MDVPVPDWAWITVLVCLLCGLFMSLQARRR